MSKEPSPDRIVQLQWQFMASKTFLSAVELSVFTELAKGPLHSDTLRQRLGLHPRSACDFFDTLVTLGVLERQGERYSNTADSDFYLDRAKPTYAGGFAEMANARLYGFFGSLTEGLRTGEPQNEIKKDENLYEALYNDPQRLRSFLAAMTGLNLPASKAMAERFPWREYQTFVDIGTAQGGLPVQVALANSHLVGGGFDLPPVGPIFEEYVASFDLQNRLRFCPGDFSRDLLPSADVLVISHVLIDHSLQEKRALVRKAYDALPKSGALIVCELLIDEERRKNLYGLLASLIMLIETQGGSNFTSAQCTGWMHQAGFRDTRVEHLVGADWMVVGIK